MGKHSKNNTALPYYTSAEKQLDNTGAGWGTQSTRIGKDSLRNFDCCWLTLQPCVDPVVTPHGYLYEREAIYESLLHQKAEIARKQKLYDEQKKKSEEEKKAKEEEAKLAEVEKFVRNETSVSGSKYLGKDKEKIGLKHNFWIPTNTPDAKPEIYDKPDTNTHCPFSGKKLKMKDLIPVKFTPLDPNKALNPNDKEKYMCPITCKTLTNSIPCAVLKKSGRVVSMAAVNEIIKKDMLDPIDGTKIEEGDIIELQRGGTGFAGNGVSLEVKKYNPSIN